MKEIKGYLIDRTTGVGIAGEPVTFKDLAGADIATGTHGTVWQEKDSVTQADGSFKFRCELSPGPIQVFLDISATEKKARKWDEKAQMGLQWSSDISRVGRGFGNGFVKGYLSDLALSIVSGHTFRIAKGQAVIDGVVWSLENIGGASGYDILGTANDPGSGINPRLDLVSLRQYKEDAAGQLAGKQDVVVTLGTTSNVVPATPTGADFTAMPIGVLSTAEGAATKTINSDKRIFLNPSVADRAPKFGFASLPSMTLTGGYQNVVTVNVTGLNPDITYDGYFHARIPTRIEEPSNSSQTTVLVQCDITNDKSIYGVENNVEIWRDLISVGNWSGAMVEMMIPIAGVSGVTTFSWDLRLQKSGGHAGTAVSIFNTGKASVYLSPRNP